MTGEGNQQYGSLWTFAAYVDQLSDGKCGCLVAYKPSFSITQWLFRINGPLRLCSLWISRAFRALFIVLTDICGVLCIGVGQALLLLGLSAFVSCGF